MDTWYILPNGNIKHVDGLEIQPENDWFPTDESLEIFSSAQRAAGKTEVQIIQRIMSLALECEQWVRDNLA
ncbi:hypothetical protein LSG25_05930 [Paralcaligenes sp. KSB-10]|uniref:hypothetical protein n=1 Tax=Paralcaligenes sp. KSB-10 TaxID=2901142 RepID=UPI001E36BCBF|nr:hypothetical protein [Paralcaligenes sp. KSB-10]UHL65427.1 hypothetical protein LSG25_05930 [Paralcaligenes sp. KSB-10]